MDIPAILNIKKRRERIVYKTLSDNDRVNISYVMGTEVTPQKNFFISDRSTSLTQNRIPNSQNYTTLNSRTITLNTNKFLVTDIYTVPSPTAPSVPLFFVHTLSNFDSTTCTLLSVEFMDLNFQSIALSEYYLDSIIGLIYNNLENKYNNRTDLFEVYLVKYTQKKVVGAVTTTEIHHELINNVPVFGEATFDDIDVYGNILDGHKKYVIEEIPGGMSYLITLPTTTTHSYKETPSSRIKVLAPDALNNSEPWNVRITNGHFIASLNSTPTTTASYRYSIAEFAAQSFFPFPPYQTRIDQAAEWITPTLIGVGKEVVYDFANGLFATITVRSVDGILKYVYTNNPSLFNTPYGESILYTDGILSIDTLYGFIEVSDAISADDEVLVSFYTSEDTYVITNLDFNPSDNLAALEERVIFYVVPETTSTGSLSKSVFYLLVDRKGRIKYSSQAAEAGLLVLTDSLTTKMLIEDFNSDGTVKHLFYYDKPSTGPGLSARWDTDFWTVDPSQFSFIDKYSVESILFKYLEAPTGDRLLNYIENGRVLILADIYTGEGSSPDSLTFLDVRVPGGGIKDEYDLAAIKIQPEVAWYSDHLAAKSYPSVGSFFAEVPQTLLEQYGGAFTRQQVIDIISRHMKAGGYPVVRTYGIDPVLTGVISTTTTLTITWPSYGPINYKVYKSTSAGYGYASVSTISDNPSGNNYSITGLSSGTVYYLKISAIDSNGYESFSQTITAQTES